MKNTIPSVCTMRHGAGAHRTFGTPCGRQLASGSSRHFAPDARMSYSAFAHGWNGTGSFRSLARSRTYPSGGFQTPDRSGLPSARRGAGADRFGFPSGVRGTDERGTFAHCAAADTVNRTTVASDCKIVF